MNTSKPTDHSHMISRQEKVAVEVFSEKLGKINLVFKNLGSSFGGLHPPLLHPSVCGVDVDSVTVVCASHPRSPEIFPIKIADLPQK